jgi:8-oxo-dGTP diphosphatase
MDGKYSLPAGHVEAGESFIQAAIRETFEEVGLEVERDDLRHVFTQQRNEGDHVRVDAFFEATKWQGEPRNAEPERHAKIAWIDVHDLSDGIMDYQLHALKGILAGETYSELGWDVDKTV